MAGIPELKRFFREAAGIDVDKSDLDRYREFVDEKVDDIAIAGRDSATWNGRDVIAPQDLPITKGLQERMREFGKMEVADEMRQWMSQTLRRPPDDVTFGEETEAVLNDVFGGLSIALARSFRIVDADVANPSTQHWARAFELYRLVF
jgi:S-adenosylmethionine hydrolase